MLSLFLLSDVGALSDFAIEMGFFSESLLVYALDDLPCVSSRALPVPLMMAILICFCSLRRINNEPAHGSCNL